jgi:NAD-dependent dihydropyrimidine dehydrogenase PreA subunit
LYLVLEDEGQIIGLGEVRENISYLNGLSISEVRSAIVGLLEEVHWESGPQEIIEFIPTQMDRYPAVARALVDCTMQDWWARQNKVCVIENLGHTFSNSHNTNQSIFWCSDKHCLEMAEGYVERNFYELKLRVGSPKKTLEMSTRINAKGANVVEQIYPEKCIKCGRCMDLCPDLAIWVCSE